MSESRLNIFTRSLGAVIFLVWSLVLLVSLDGDASSLPDQDLQINRTLEQSNNTGPGISPLFPVWSGLSITDLLDFYFPPADCSIDYLCTLHIHHQTVQVHLKVFDHTPHRLTCLITHCYTIRSQLSGDAGPFYS